MLVTLMTPEGSITSLWFRSDIHFPQSWISDSDSQVSAKRVAVSFRAKAILRILFL